jgi:hypothetical protein
MQRRLSFILLLSAVFAWAAFAQTGTSSGGTSGGSATGTSSTGTATTGTGTTGTAPAPGSTAATTPIAPPAGSGVTGTAPATGGTAATTPIAPPAGSGVDPATGTATSGTTNANGTGVNTNNNTGFNGGVVGNTTGGAPMAPEVHIETVMPAPGATSNQPGAPAGATSMTNPVGTPSSPNTFSVPVQENATQPQRDPNAGSNAATMQDMNGLVFANGAVSAEAADNRSLAEIAAQYKRGRSTQNARVITNDDIARLNARNDVNVMGANQNAALPQGESAAAPAQQQPATAAPANRKRSPFTPKTNQQPQSNEQPK